MPREIVHREKLGFGVPVGKWFRNELRDMLRDHLLADDDGARLFNRSFIEHMLKEHESERWDWTTQLWPLLVFRMWYQRFPP